MFELDYFRENPRPFYLLAKELYPGQYPPTPTHHFVNLLHRKAREDIVNKCEQALD